MNMSRRIAEFARNKAAEYSAVMGGADAPPCQSFAVVGKPKRCGVVSEFVTKEVTPAGYSSLCCAKHRPRDQTAADLWGSDPGWPSTWESVEEARALHATN